MIKIKVDKKELSNILGVKEGTLKNIESKKQLKNRLKEKGYKYINKFKDGRKTYYEIELINENKEVYSNLCKYVFNVNKEVEFSKYFTVRTLSNGNDIFPLNCADISKIANVTSKTIGKWDTKLLDKDIIRKNGYYYFSMNTDTKDIMQCSKEEYLSFWKNKALLSALDSLQLKYVKGLITLTELQLATMDIGATITAIKGKYYFRTKKYITNKDNQLYIDTLDLIKQLKNNLLK